MMNAESKLVQTASFLILAMLTVAATLTFASTTALAQEKTIASAKAGSSIIRLTNENGKFVASENHFCVVFQNIDLRSTFDFSDVTVDFVLLVGRIREKPITAHLGSTVAGRSCGQINLGRQYFSPANYQALVHYTDGTGKKLSTRLSFAVR